MPKVSIVIPVYNVEPYLKQALDSVVNQTLTDIEIICIDDCSTDGSYEILQEYAKKDNRFVILHHMVNQGLGITRNNGIKKVTANYTMFLDPDDWLELDACEKAYNQISINDDDVVFFNSQTCDENGNFVSVDKRLAPYKRYFDGQSFSLKKIKDNFILNKIACWTRIYNTEFLRKNNIYFPEARRAEDIPFSIKLYLNAGKVSVINSILINYRKPKKYSSKKNLQNTKYVYNMLKESYELIINAPDNKYILNHYLVYLIKLCINRYTRHKINLYQNWQTYKKSREILKYINQKHDIREFQNKFDIVKYHLFLLCPNCIIFDFVYYLLANNTTIDNNHIIFNICKIKIKIQIKSPYF